MTIYESTAIWLSSILTDPANGFTGRFKIDTEIIPDGKNQSGLFSNPNDIQTQGLGGQVKHQSFKTWLIRRTFSEFDNRLANEVFFEKLSKAIYQKNLRGQYPQDGRKWRAIGYKGGIFIAQRVEDNSEATYQVSLELTWEE